MEQVNGSGLIGVFVYPEHTGLFTVLPSDQVGLREGFYSVNLSKNIYTNMNPQLLINSYSHQSLDEMEGLTKQPITGMGIDGLLKSPVWGYKKHASGLFY